MNKLKILICIASAMIMATITGCGSTSDEKIYEQFLNDECSIVKQMDTLFKYIFMERQNYSCLSM